MSSTVKDFYESPAGHLILDPSLWPEQLDHMVIAENYWLLGRANKSMTVADFGCGHGRHLVSLADDVREIHGIDISESMLKISADYTKSYSNVYLHERDVADTHLPSNSIDLCICMMNTFNNFPHQPDALAEMKRVCKVGGTIVVTLFSENAAPMQQEFYKNIAMKLGVTNLGEDFAVATDSDVTATFDLKGEKVVLRSERCTTNRIRRMFGESVFDILPLQKIGYLCIIKN